MINNTKIVDELLKNGFDFEKAVVDVKTNIQEKLEKVKTEIQEIHDKLKVKNKQKRQMEKDLKQLEDMKTNFESKYMKVD